MRRIISLASLAALLVVLAAGAFALTQFNDGGTVTTTPELITLSSITPGRAQSVFFENLATSTDDIEICLNKSIQANCDFVLEPGDSITVDGQQARELAKFEFKAAATTANWKLLVIF